MRLPVFGFVPLYAERPWGADYDEIFRSGWVWPKKEVTKFWWRFRFFCGLWIAIVVHSVFWRRALVKEHAIVMWVPYRDYVVNSIAIYCRRIETGEFSCAVCWTIHYMRDRNSLALPASLEWTVLMHFRLQLLEGTDANTAPCWISPVQAETWSATFSRPAYVAVRIFLTNA